LSQYDWRRRPCDDFSQHKRHLQCVDPLSGWEEEGEGREGKEDEREDKRREGGERKGEGREKGKREMVPNFLVQSDTNVSQ